MKREDPISNNFDEIESEFRDLADLIAEIPDKEPPDELLSSIMAQIKPKKAPWWRRLIHRLYLPVTVAPVKLIPAGAVLALILVVSFYFGFTMGTKRMTPVVAQNVPATAETTTVVFSLKDPRASKVHVIGSFNHWSPKGYEMRYDKKSKTWVLAVKLPEGRYEYAFLLDGKTIMPDPKALMQKDDGFGNKNSILIVERQDGTKTQS